MWRYSTLCFISLLLSSSNGALIRARSTPLNEDLDGSGASQIETSGDTFCLNENDGLYQVNPCSSEVFYCNSGKSLRMSCALNRLFDVETKSCVPSSDLPECPASLQGSRSSPTLTCSANGLQSLGTCSSTAVYCASGNPQLFECEYGTVFDTISASCLLPSDVDECSALSSEQEEENFAMDEHFEAVPEKRSADSTVEHADNSFSCSGKGDGLFSLGCESSFLTCSGGVSRLMQCPEDLRFDATIQACEYEGNVAECSGKDEESSGGSGGDPSHCTEESSGEWFATGSCSETFATCQGTRTVELTCPDGLIYNADSAVCDYPDNVPGCLGSGEGSGESSGESSGEESGEESGEASGEESGEASGEESGEASGENSGTEEYSGTEESGLGSGDSSGASGETEEGSADLGEHSGLKIQGDFDIDNDFNDVNGEDQFVDQLPIDSVPGTSMDCSEKTNGFHSLGCSATLVACQDGEATQFNCPDGFVFDGQLGVCNFATAVAECQNEEPAQEQLMVSPPHDEMPLEEAPAAESTPAPCEGRMDGSYSLSCDEPFLMCNDERSTVLNCDAGMTLNEEIHQCVPVGDHPMCFQQVESTTTEQNVQDSNEFTTLFGDKANDIVCPFVSGFMADPAAPVCSTSFIRCDNSFASRLTCDVGLVYSAELESCAPFESVPDCQAQNIGF